MTGTVRIRPMRAADAPAVATLIRRAFAAQPMALDPPPSALHVKQEDVVRHLATAGGAVAEDERLVGTILWEQHGTALRLSRLAVDPERRRQGVARNLLAEAEAEARRRGLFEMTLGTRLALSANRRLFARAGFVEVAQHAHPGYDRPTRVELRKRLG